MPNIDKDMNTCTHWDGCWFDHHKCALARLEKFERANGVLERANKTLEEKLKHFKEKCKILEQEEEKYIDLVIKIQDLIKNTISWKI